ncbi:MAG: hypothetical protein KA428_11465, partial [Chitinophagaceae bacterium]|nr:hypothetical protein [Chitinophagaceae bacterium]
MNKAICHQAGGLSLGFLGVRVKIDLIYNRILRKKKAIPSRAAVIACTKKLPLPGSIYNN